MAQKWTEKQLGKPGTGGIENFSARTGFVPAAFTGEIAFGTGLVTKTGAENEVVPYGHAEGGVQFAGVAKFSQEATVFSKTHTGPTANNAVYPIAYKAGDVVGLVDRGSVIVKIDAASSGVQAGDRMCVLKDGTFDAYKNITVATGGSKKGLLIDAIAGSDASAGDCIAIEVYSLASEEFKFN